MEDKKNGKIISVLLPLILLIAGLYLVPISIFHTDLSKIPGDLGDARFNNYILEHGHQYISGKVDKYWDAPFMYPSTNVIAFSDNLLGTLPIYSVFRFLGNDRETSFQLWLLTLFALNFICCYRVLNKWAKNPILAATGAYIFAFSIFILGHIYNVQSFPRFIVPFVFYWMWKYLTEKNLKYFVYLMLGIVFQFYCGIYLGFFLVYTLLFFLLAYLLIYRDWAFFTQFKKIKTSGYHVLTILASGALMAPLMLPYLEISRKFGMRKFEDTVTSIPTLRSYFFTTKAPVLWSFLSEHAIPVLPEWWCHFLFMGALPWIGVLCVPVFLLSKKIESPKKKMIAFLFTALFFSFIFCLRINDFSLYRLIFKIPGFSSMRSINRVINTEVMFFILIFVFIFNEWSKRSRIMLFVAMSFPVLIVLDNLIDPREVNTYVKKDSQEQIAMVEQSIKSQFDHRHQAIAYLPLDVKKENVIRTHLNVMLAAQELNIPCVNGYSGTYPDAFLAFFNSMNYPSLQIWMSDNHIDKSKIQIINDFGVNEADREAIHLKAANGKFVSADEASTTVVAATSDVASAWETFSFISIGKNCVILGHANRFFSAQMNQQGEVEANRTNIGDWETFTVVKLDNNNVAIKASNNKYLTLDEKSFQLIAAADSIGKNERFQLIKN